ncbi:MAG: AAA family ATPase [bacterium]|nr:AAA family ATPase [bacterium]
MRLEKILSLLAQKESRILEFKEARRDVPSSLFETVCSFLNRDGGDIFLGVHDSGEIIGIEEPVIDKMIREITINSNNPQVLDPPFILFPEKINVEGRWILYIQIPESSSVFRCKGIVYDRSADGDFKLKGPERIAALTNKKKGFYSEARVYPFIELSGLDAGVIQKTRNRIYSRNPEHPWLPLSDEEMLARAGLIKKDIDTGIKGLTLAAVLLFGKEETIQSIIPQYKIDVLVKRHNLSRYDDRLDVRSNLLEAYPTIMSFLGRYLPDPFYMEKDVRLSLREKIFREAVANLLVHREYLHQYPARIIITSEQVVFTNPCNPAFKGNIEVNNYYPHQKNPLISKFFLQLGWVEEIGSGIYNINKYLPLYSPGRKAHFVEDVIFTTTIPIPNLDDLQKRDMKGTTTHDTIHDTIHDTMHDTMHDAIKITKLLKILKGEMSREEILSKLELKSRDNLRKVYLKPALESDFIELTLPGKLRSKKQKYRVTEKGKIFLENRLKQHE